MCDVVVATDHYGTVRIPGYIREAFRRWVASDDFPRDVPIRIEGGKLIVNIRQPENHPRPNGSDRPVVPVRGKAGRRATTSGKGSKRNQKRKNQDDGSLVIEYDRR